MSFTYPAGILSKTPVTPSGSYAESSASGVWKLNEVAYWIKQGLWPNANNPTPNDPYFQYVTSLLHGDGTNGGQNNTFLDSSSNAFTITRNGNTTQGSFSPYGSNWGNYFDGSSSYLAASTSNLTLGTGDFTAECWFYRTVANDSSTAQCIFADGSDAGGLVVAMYQNKMYCYFVGAGGIFNSVSPTIVNGTWNHFAWTRSGSTMYAFLNGVLLGTTSNSGDHSSTGGFAVGDTSASGTNMNNWQGYISNVRLVKGTALYTSSFTPITSPLTAVSGTQMLTAQSNRFIDNSTNAYTFTLTGTPTVSRFSPFAPTYSTQYSTSTIGGSGYYDGSGDYLSASSNAAFALPGDFTLEAWIYPTVDLSTTERFVFWAHGTGGIIFGNRPGGFGIRQTDTGDVLLIATRPQQNTWTHVAAVRSGSTLTIYYNGVSQGSTSTAASFSQAAMEIGGSTGTEWTGYISDARIVKGTAVYTTNFTPPTSPLTNVSNTSILLNYTNAAIYDNAMIPDYETVGNAQISTSVKKYGTGSVYFDGTGDSMKAPANSTFKLSGNFTIEGWVYPTGLNNELDIFCIGNQNTTGLLFYNQSSTQKWRLYSNGEVLLSSITAANNTWYHFAIARVGSTIKLFINGTQVASATNSSTFDGSTGSGIVVGGSYDGTFTTSPGAFYLDDLRVTNGYARYWENFTPPATALPNFGGAYQVPTQDPQFNYTTLLLPGNGTNGAQNNTFLDSSSNAFTITRNGNTTQGTFTPFSQTGWGNYFNASNLDNLNFSNGSNFAFGTGDYTIEFWINGPLNTDRLILDFRSGGSGNGFVIATGNGSGNAAGCLRYSGANEATSGNVLITNNQWNHCAVVRSSGTIKLYINGTFMGSCSDSTNYSSTSGTIYIGHSSYSNSYNLTAYLSNLRIVKGTALYTSNFTPSTTPLTAVSGTSLLTCQSNRFIDNSGNSVSLSVTGSPSVQAFSPFAPTAAYSTSTVGGSGYFDGSGDWITSANGADLSLGSGDFTIETWVYSSTANPNSDFVGKWGGSGSRSYSMRWRTSQGLRFDSNTGGLAEYYFGGTLNANSWNHLAITRSGDNLRGYINGVQTGSTQTLSGTLATTSNGVTMGRSDDGPEAYFTGYLSNSRITKGTALYTGSTYTVPTAPFTNSSGTSLLLNYTNAGIADATANNNLETAGDAQISTTQSKFGGSSLKFDGTGDYLLAASSPNISFGSGDFTVEAWVYINSTTSYMTLMASYPYHQNGISTVAFRVGTGGTYASWTDGGGTPAASLGGLSWSANTWYHVAWVRYNGVVTMYRNGAVVGTVSDSTNFSVGGQSIGADFDAGTFTNGFNGYINDLRITKGYARYVQPFTPPTQADQLY